MNFFNMEVPASTTQRYEFSIYEVICDAERRGSTQRAPGPDAGSPTQSAPVPNTESAGARQREGRGPDTVRRYRAPRPDTESAPGPESQPDTERRGKKQTADRGASQQNFYCNRNIQQHFLLRPSETVHPSLLL